MLNKKAFDVIVNCNLKMNDQFTAASNKGLMMLDLIS